MSDGRKTHFGPLPKTKSGHDYLLTIMCASTRFPEAIPFRNIKTKNIVKALVKFFTFEGLPKFSVGSGFKFYVWNFSIGHACRALLSINRHLAILNMIRSYCFDTENDEGIHLLLFAVRESVQESLGFSPFELVFGQTVR